MRNPAIHQMATTECQELPKPKKRCSERDQESSRTRRSGGNRKTQSKTQAVMPSASQGYNNNNNWPKSIFYADDGVLIGRDPAEVQKFLDIYTEAFASVGLQMNVAKTKSMTMSGRKSLAPMSSSAYRRKTTGEGISFAERMKTKATCPLCDTEVQSTTSKPTNRRENAWKSGEERKMKRETNQLWRWRRTEAMSKWQWSISPTAPHAQPRTAHTQLTYRNA
jgi:hypothetical protein